MATSQQVYNAVHKAFQVVLNFWMISNVLSTCQFPRFINHLDVWTMKNEEGGTLTAYIKPSIMQAKYCQYAGARCQHYSRQCYKDKGNNKYVVKHEIRSAEYSPSSYLCMQFVFRSSTVLQLMTSEIVQMPLDDLCNRISLNNWLLISSTSFGKTPSINCPFSGGYNLEIRSEDSGVLCSNKMLSPRIESECEPGDGITFDFKHPDCIHNSLKSMKLRLRHHVDCVATWQLGVYQFLVLRPDPDHALCFRMEKPLDDIKHAYLFMDLVCDPGNSEGQPQDSKNLLSIRFDRKTIHSVCENEFEGCSDERVCDTDMKEHCKRTCGQCQADRACAFPEYLRRVWGLYNQDFRSSNHMQYVNITNYEINFPNVGRFQCLFNNVSGKHKSILLHTFENGCYPKFTCMETFYTSETVRQFRLGSRINWPMFPLHRVKDQACNPLNFKEDIQIGGTRQFMSVPYITVVDPSYVKSVNCELANEFRNHERGLYFREKNRCDGCIYYDSNINSQQFDVRTITCPDAFGFIEYICLASYKFDNETTAVVTGTKVGSSSVDTSNIRQFLCWIFTGYGKKRKIIVLDASDCNEVQFKKAKVRDMQPRSAFDVIENSPKQCPLTYQPVKRRTTPFPDPTPVYTNKASQRSLPTEVLTTYNDESNQTGFFLIDKDEYRNKASDIMENPSILILFVTVSYMQSVIDLSVNTLI